MTLSRTRSAVQDGAYLSQTGTLPIQRDHFIREIQHVLQHSAIDVLIRCDCKGVVTLVNRILDGQGYDSKNNDADLLEAIHNICQTVQCNRKIVWMPAHLDNPKNKKKL